MSADREEHPVYADFVKFGPLSRGHTGHLLAARTGHAAGNPSIWQTTAAFLLIITQIGTLSLPTMQAYLFSFFAAVKCLFSHFVSSPLLKLLTFFL